MEKTFTVSAIKRFKFKGESLRGYELEDGGIVLIVPKKWYRHPLKRIVFRKYGITVE